MDFFNRAAFCYDGEPVSDMRLSGPSDLTNIHLMCLDDALMMDVKSDRNGDAIAVLWDQVMEEWEVVYTA